LTGDWSPSRRLAGGLRLGIVLAVACAANAAAQTDEIQVYDAALTGRGTFNLTLHNNYVADGLKTPAFAGAVTADHSWNGAFEWALGVSRWFEAGLYLPIYTRDDRQGWGLDGLKLRALFAVPDAAHRRFVYGLNLESSFNARWWDSTRFTSEVRPILGWHAGPIDVFANPILDTTYDGFGGIDFAPVLRVAFNRNAWAIAAEEYADLGPLRGLHPVSAQSHQLFAVLGYRGAVFGVEAGVGFGLTTASDRLTFKLMLSRDLNAAPASRARVP
jgi:hypothetical protein